MRGNWAQTRPKRFPMKPFFDSCPPCNLVIVTLLLFRVSLVWDPSLSQSTPVVQTVSLATNRKDQPPVPEAAYHTVPEPDQVLQPDAQETRYRQQESTCQPQSSYSTTKRKPRGPRAPRCAPLSPAGIHPPDPEANVVVEAYGSYFLREGCTQWMWRSLSA